MAAGRFSLYMAVPKHVYACASVFYCAAAVALSISLSRLSVLNCKGTAGC